MGDLADRVGNRVLERNGNRKRFHLFDFHKERKVYYNRSVGSRYGILPGAFNPPTEAHLALAEAALSIVDEVLFILPGELPHKEYSGVPFKARMELLRSAIAHQPRFQAATSHGGLFVQIARELRAARIPEADLYFLCGRDAAERIVEWDYGSPDAFPAIIQEFRLLVAARNGEYAPPERYRRRISQLALPVTCDHISSTAIRELIRNGSGWEHLVPPAIRERVRQLYQSG